jgi:hypothetical protein
MLGVADVPRATPDSAQAAQRDLPATASVTPESRGRRLDDERSDEGGSRDRAAWSTEFVPWADGAAAPVAPPDEHSSGVFQLDRELSNSSTR